MKYPLDAHRAALGRLTRDPIICTCTPENPRHVQPWFCVTDAQLAAWTASADYREAPMIGRTPQNARRLAYLWLYFSQDAEARRLSGRPDALPLDAWDDARGMSRLESLMFREGR